MPVQVPEQARCLKCGYQLRGLDEPVCPECSRAFDPEDPKTYITDPQKRRRRWLIRLAIIGLLIGGAGFALWPQQILTAKMTFTMRDSEHIITFRRWELESPNWIPFTYPGLHWRSDTKGSAPQSEGEPYSFRIKAKYLQGWTNGFNGQDTSINGIYANPDHANELLKALLDPANKGIRFGPRVAESVSKGSGSN